MFIDYCARHVCSCLPQDVFPGGVLFGLEGRVTCSAGGAGGPRSDVPGRSCPCASNDDSAAPSVSLPDLSVSGIALPASLHPPVMCAASAEQERFRQGVRSAIQSLFASSAAPGTVRTYGATLRAIAPRVTAKPSSRVLPMNSEGALFTFVTAAVLHGPKSPSTHTGQPAVHSSYVEPAKAAVAFWHVVRGMRAVSDAEWPPRMGASWAEIRRSRVFASLVDKLAVCTRGETDLARLRPTVASDDPPAVGFGIGRFFEDAVVVRSAASMSVAFFGVRRASEVAALDLSEISADS